MARRRLTPPPHRPAEPAAPAGERPAAVLPARPRGPFDVAEVADTAGLLDLGPLLLPRVPTVELRATLDEAGAPVELLACAGGWHLRLELFAAPRSRGLGAAALTELAAALVAQGGQSRSVPGPYGAALAATLPGPGGQVVPLHVLGVDGPGWFLRATFQREVADPDATQQGQQGPHRPEAPQDHDAAQEPEWLELDETGLPRGPLGELLLGTRVRRGTHPLVPGTVLPLRLDRALLPDGTEQQAGPAPGPGSRFAHLPGVRL